MNDSVLSYHMNPFGCGVAKFNHQLAARLGVPCEDLKSANRVCPLVSVKPSEIPEEEFPHPFGTYDLFLHDWHESIRNFNWIREARTVYAANDSIRAALIPHRPDVVGAWCPSTVLGTSHRAPFSILVFGMGHKLHFDHLKRLKRILDASHLTYTVHASTAVHEGHPWDATFSVLSDVLRDIFCDRVRVLGYLADDALASELEKASLVALFYDPAVRANNTTLWAALDAGKPAITNLDEDSPEELVHNKSVLDLRRVHTLEGVDLTRIGQEGKKAAMGKSWARLMSVLV